MFPDLGEVLALSLLSCGFINCVVWLVLVGNTHLVPLGRVWSSLILYCLYSPNLMIIRNFNLFIVFFIDSAMVDCCWEIGFPSQYCICCQLVLLHWLDTLDLCSLGFCCPNYGFFNVVPVSVFLGAEIDGAVASFAGVSSMTALGFVTAAVTVGSVITGVTSLALVSICSSVHCPTGVGAAGSSGASLVNSI
jgi:hypothetical protein